MRDALRHTTSVAGAVKICSPHYFLGGLKFCFLHFVFQEMQFDPVCCAQGYPLPTAVAATGRCICWRNTFWCWMKNKNSHLAYAIRSSRSAPHTHVARASISRRKPMNSTPLSPTLRVGCDNNNNSNSATMKKIRHEWKMMKVLAWMVGGRHRQPQHPASVRLPHPKKIHSAAVFVRKIRRAFRDCTDAYLHKWAL